jgi:alpha/beta superfamily hydrolase
MQIVEGIAFIVVLTLLLIGITALAGRRRRRAGGSPVKREPARGWKDRLLYILRLAGFTLLSLVVVMEGLLVFLSIQSLKQDLAPTPAQVEIPPDLGFTVEKVEFTGGDGQAMRGWYASPQNGVTVIVLHGYGATRAQMIWHAQALTEAGYGVLMYDERASGESEGASRSYGWNDPPDVARAVAYLNRRAGGSARIGIAGCSIGAQIALQGAAYTPQIAAVWADGPSYINTLDLPAPANAWMVLNYWGNLNSDWIQAIWLRRSIPKPLRQIVGTIEPRPIMMIGGGVPQPLYGAEEQLTRHLHSFAGPHAGLWIIPEARHCDGPVVRPDEYRARLVGFFDAAFGLAR